MERCIVTDGMLGVPASGSDTYLWQPPPPSVAVAALPRASAASPVVPRLALPAVAASPAAAAACLGPWPWWPRHLGLSALRSPRTAPAAPPRGGAALYAHL